MNFNNIFIVDDDSASIFLNKYYLKKHSPFYKNLFSFTDPEKAMDQIGNRDIRNKDLLLLDLEMPEMSGLELLDTLKLVNPNCFNNLLVFIISATQNQSLIREVRKHPLVHAIFAKPLNSEMISNILIAFEELGGKKQIPQRQEANAKSRSGF